VSDLVVCFATAPVVACGVGGAYPGSGLVVGDVVCAETETYGDLRARVATGFLDMAAVGFPVIASVLRPFNRLPLDIFPVGRRASICATCTGR
jgi:hypothetical protein